ncbi:MAG: hypothetical protein L0Y66_02150 [Myxococcaceae bacterium]|nr:hypothetical protein [Myxococcaceae bacterium]MCI0671532.1 hypothetical protein [Myxococcaceae bacterium]
MSPEPVVFERVAVLCYRLYDIADEIQLEPARRLLTETTRPLRLQRAGSQYVQLPSPPLGFELGRRPLTLKAGTLSVDVSVRVFDHGAASVTLKVPVPAGTSLEALTALGDELEDSQNVDALCVDVVEGVRSRLARVLEGSHLWEQNESYTLFFAEAIQGNPSARHLLERADLPRLLLGEVEADSLSTSERAAVLASHFSYTDEDLVVIDWNAAFVYEPSGSMDIPDLIELANAQLLELRYYDDQLDTSLRGTYDEVGRRKRQWYSIFRSPYRQLARRTLVTLLEINEFVERAENSLKIVGDVYLAKVYEAAVQQVRVPAWQQSVTRKQGLLAHTYELLKGEVETDRALTLEATIVVLIVSEILLGVLKVLGP